MKKNAPGVATATLATPHASVIRALPAEWEAAHAATWLAWPHEPTDWPGKSSVPWVFAGSRAQSARRRTHSPHRLGQTRKEQFAKGVLSESGVSLKRVDFVHLATDRSWTRDFLPLGLVKGRGKKRETALVKWKFNGWARYKNHARDEQAGLAVALQLGAPLRYREAQFEDGANAGAWCSKAAPSTWTAKARCWQPKSVCSTVVKRATARSARRARRPCYAIAERRARALARERHRGRRHCRPHRRLARFVAPEQKSCWPRRKIGAIRILRF